jgi:hypothetical protein
MQPTAWNRYPTWRAGRLRRRCLFRRVRCCIIRRSGPNADCNMQWLKHRRAGEGRWQKALIVIAICSLTVSVATRFWSPCFSQSHALKSTDRRPVEPKRQHLNRDATQWMAPIASFTVRTTVVATHLAPAIPLHSTRFFDQSLYNRPPPSSGFFV